MDVTSAPAATLASGPAVITHAEISTVSPVAGST